MNNNFVPGNILIVDDTPANLDVLASILKGHGYKVRPAPSGKLALQAAMTTPPDLILLDINMPEMDGYEVCACLKSNPVLADIPVLFISALSETIDKLKAFSVGGSDYITKPFQSEEVIARVKTHLKLYQTQLILEKFNRNLQQLVQDKVREISEAQLATILALSRLAESRDDDTGKHLERTREFCKLLALQLQTQPGYAEIIDDAFIENIFHASPLHDIGKVAIPDVILLKPGKLTPDEFEIMKTHTLRGAATLQSVHDQHPQNAFITMGIQIARSHHEKWDGSGYPDGLAADAIPLSAQIMALADVYDALRATRCYKDAFTHERSCEIILASRGQHFSPAILDAFIAVEQEFDKIHTEMFNKQ